MEMTRQNLPIARAECAGNLIRCLENGRFEPFPRQNRLQKSAH